VNSGSLEADLLNKYGVPCAQALVESALRHAAMLEECDFNDIVISIKSSNVRQTIEAYRLLSERCDYPLHLGVTEAGTERMGIMKSAIGIGSLLADGIGDTVRVSLTADCEKEVFAGIDILKAVGLRENGASFISCPTCGRTKIDLINLAERVEAAMCGIKKDIKIAIMGCAVNGPGEAREADIGVAGGDGCGLIFRKGEIIRKVPEEEIVSALMQEAEKL
jgi:(E)-4-hydroxy-3-methylbut-2-enyl-diphosphate synthase